MSDYEVTKRFKTMNLKAILAAIHRGELQQSKKSLQQYLKTSPDSVDGLNLLGLCYQKEAMTERATLCFSKAVDVNPKHLKSRVNLAICEAQVHQYDSAIASFKICERLSADNIDVLNSLGNLYRIVGKFDLAMQYLQKAQRLAPNHPGIAENIALLNLKIGHFEVAKQGFKQLLLAFPNRVELHLGISECWYKLGEPERAKSQLRPLLQQSKLLDKVYNLLAVIAKKSENIAEATDYYLSALKQNNNNAEIHFNLALLYKELGQTTLSQNHFLSAIHIQKNWFEAYFHLAYSPKFIFSDQQAKSMLELARKHDGHPDLYWLQFACAKYYEGEKQYQKSFESLKKARQCFALHRNTSNVKPRPFAKLKQMPITKQVFDPHRKLETPDFVFITGLPRSGTTLTEQILAGHHNTFAIGESGLVSQLATHVERLTGKPYYLGVYDLSRERKQELIKHQCRMRRLATDKCIVDASPNNLFYIGFINEMFPCSKVVICRRSPLDNCLSIYQHPLERQAYSDTLNALAEHYQQCHQLTVHWLTQLPETCKELVYENLACQPKKYITMLLTQIGLDIDDACFHPQNNARLVRTPSSEQVRQPISTNSIGKWQTFAPYIEKLTTPLAPLEISHQQRISMVLEKNKSQKPYQ
ncbi:tetratricopeptide repeat protein [Thalassotalea litorea]|uniref:Tetratricopeptide repeat protein n=2 Tax=Thalassotalea litorea TaxID=2020715 RepID=A0A5R9IET0_9GAMM|nr:tetratricopeptide repeat protein [Thalassotalea litorea]